jgi:hypothetical protein
VRPCVCASWWCPSTADLSLRPARSRKKKKGWAVIVLYSEQVGLNVLELGVVDGIYLTLALELGRVVRLVHDLDDLAHLLAQQVAQLLAQHLTLWQDILTNIVTRKNEEKTKKKRGVTQTVLVRQLHELDLDGPDLPGYVLRLEVERPAALLARKELERDLGGGAKGK